MGKLYIAYGSNLNMRQMYGRCPGAKFLGTGVIENYALQFKGSPHGAHATIAPQEGSAVPVGIWRIQKRDEKSLDMYEGYHEKGYCYYDKEQIPVKFENGMQIDGMVYIMDKTKDFGFPTYGYYQTCLQGYRDCGLDTRVLEEALKESVQLAREQTWSAQEVQAIQAVQQPNEIQETQERQEPLDQMKFV